MADGPADGSGVDTVDRGLSGDSEPRQAPIELTLSAQWSSPAALLRELYQARELLSTLARRDFFVRYRRAAFGIGWSVMLPVVQAVTLAVVLGRVTNLKVAHFPLFILSGIAAWTYFLGTLTAGSTSIVDNTALSSRIYFPRAVLPLAVCGSNIFGLVISLVVLLAAVLIANVGLGLHTLLIVPAVGILVAVTAGFVLLLSAAHVYFRDTRYAVQAASFAWFYVTPVFYPLDLLHGWVRELVEINPVTGPVGLFHAAALGTPVNWVPVAWSCGWAIALLCAALVAHCRYDRLFADLL